MNQKKVKNLVKQINQLHDDNDFSDYIPTFEFHYFKINGDIKKTLNEYFKKIYNSDSFLSCELHEIKNYKNYIKKQIKTWLMPDKHFSKVFKNKDKIDEVSLEVMQELLSVNWKHVYKVIGGFGADCIYSETLFIHENMAHYLYLGISD
jgi:hypothetical protein